jgi:predicted RNA-binding Zn-ribbon protein involved in translation (DUF1610 family)
MSAYHYAMKFDENGCPECGGENSRKKQTKFVCVDCDFRYP